jgi:hypothetical protein
VKQVVILVPVEPIRELIQTAVKVLVAGGSYALPLGMDRIMAPCGAFPLATVDSNAIANRSHASQNDVCGTRHIDTKNVI